jgi:hypothetical protein
MRTAWLIVALLLGANSAASAGEETYTLRYKFAKGERVRWEVVHRSQVKTTVGETTKTADTLSKSVKLWRVTDVKPDGSVTFEHLVEYVDMRQNLSGRSEVRYDSRSDKTPPLGFTDVAASVRVVLAVVTMDSRGNILKRQREDVPAGAVNKEGYMTIPLPEAAVPVGHTWSFPYTMEVPLETGGIKKIETLQRYTLESVKTGVATIRVATVLLTPISDPAIEAKVVERTAEGSVRFDIEAGRMLSEQMDVDKQVVGFRGASSLHVLSRFHEELLTGSPETAEHGSGPRR